SHAAPSLTAIFGAKQNKTPSNGIAQNNPILLIPEGHAIQKSLRVGIGELQFPLPAAIHGLVDTRLLTGSRAQQVSGVRANRFHVAEIQCLCTGHMRDCPVLAAIPGTQIGAMRSTGPDHSGLQGADTSQIFNSIAGLNGNFLRAAGAAEQQHTEGRYSHAEQLTGELKWTSYVKSRASEFRRSQPGDWSVFRRTLLLLTHVSHE